MLVNAATGVPGRPASKCALVPQSTSRKRGRPPRMDTDPALRRNSTRQLLKGQPRIGEPLERPHRADGRDETLRG